MEPQLATVRGGPFRSTEGEYAPRRLREGPDKHESLNGYMVMKRARKMINIIDDAVYRFIAAVYVIHQVGRLSITLSSHARALSHHSNHAL